MSPRQKGRPTLAVIRSTPSKAWGSGITLDPVAHHKAAPSPEPLTPLTPPSEAPEVLEWLQSLYDEYAADWIATQEELNARAPRFAAKRIASAKGALTRAKKPETVEEIHHRLIELWKYHAEAVGRLEQPITAPDPSRVIRRVSGSTAWTVRGWANFAHPEGGMLGVGGYSPLGEIVRVEVAGAHPELAARIASTIRDYCRECKEAGESITTAPTLTVC